MMRRDSLKSPQLQNGAVLAVSLLILVVLTIIGVSGMVTTSLEEKMSGNFRDRQIAFNAAETALAYAENFANANINSASIFDNTNGYYEAYNGPGLYNAFDSSWWATGASQVYPNTIDGVSTCPGVGGMCAYGRFTGKLGYAGRDVGVKLDGKADGGRIAYCTLRSDGFQIQVLELESGRVTTVTDGGGCEDPSWSPDGRSILYSRKAGGRSDLYVTNLSERRALRVSRGSGRYTVPDWSTFPEGTLRGGSTK